MKVLVGLGNPENKYDGTRHNAGFMFVNLLAKHPEITPVGESLNFSMNEKWHAEIAEANANGEKILLVKPQTYMNLSGESVSKILSFYKLEAKDIVVVLDDIDLPLGTIRIRNEGSSGGHKGLQNILDMVGDSDFTRIRIGIRAINGDSDITENSETQLETKTFVLDKFTDREKPVLALTLEKAVEYYIEHVGSKNDFIPSHTIEIKLDSL